MDTVTQLNIVVSNAPGSLAALTDRLRAAEVNINAISCTEGRERTTVHLILDDPETAKLTLQSLYRVTTTEVLTCKLKNKPGALADISRACAASGISILNIYATTCGRGKEATAYVTVNDVKKAQELLKKWEKQYGGCFA